MKLISNKCIIASQKLNTIIEIINFPHNFRFPQLKKLLLKEFLHGLSRRFRSVRFSRRFRFIGSDAASGRIGARGGGGFVALSVVDVVIVWFTVVILCVGGFGLEKAPPIFADSLK